MSDKGDIVSFVVIVISSTKQKWVQRGRPLHMSHNNSIGLSKTYNVKQRNKHAGICIAFNKKSIKLKSIRRFGDASEVALQSRCLFVRIIMPFHHVILGCVYFPSQYLRCISPLTTRLRDSINKMMGMTRANTTPMIGTDFMAKFALMLSQNC